MRESRSCCRFVGRVMLWMLVSKTGELHLVVGLTVELDRDGAHGRLQDDVLCHGDQRKNCLYCHSELIRLVPMSRYRIESEDLGNQSKHAATNFCQFACGALKFFPDYTEAP